MECRDGMNEVRGFKKRGCAPLHDARSEKDILAFVFGPGDSLFITIFASIFAALGIILNFLVLVAVLNYPTTRRIVRTFPELIRNIHKTNLTVLAPLIFSGHDALHPLHHRLRPDLLCHYTANHGDEVPPERGGSSPYLTFSCFCNQEDYLSPTMCQFYPVIYYTVQVGFPAGYSPVKILYQSEWSIDYFCERIRISVTIPLQGASLFSLTVVTLNRAAMLFLPTSVEKVIINY